MSVLEELGLLIIFRPNRSRLLVHDQDHLRTCTPQAFCISPLCPLDSVPYLFYGAWMDWAFAIERNREPLLRIVAALFAMIGLTEAG